MDIEHIKYTLRHKKAFLKIEKELLNKNTFRGYLHDVDKLFLYLFQNPNHNWVSNWHRKHSKHHSKNAKTKEDFIQMIIDWECARYTKLDKPLNARDTLKIHFPELKDKVLPIIQKLGL